MLVRETDAVKRNRQEIQNILPDPDILTPDEPQQLVLGNKKRRSGVPSRSQRDPLRLQIDAPSPKASTQRNNRPPVAAVKTPALSITFITLHDCLRCCLKTASAFPMLAKSHMQSTGHRSNRYQPTQSARLPIQTNVERTG